MLKGDSYKVKILIDNGSFSTVQTMWNGLNINDKSQFPEKKWMSDIVALTLLSKSTEIEHYASFIGHKRKRISDLEL